MEERRGLARGRAQHAHRVDALASPHHRAAKLPVLAELAQSTNSQVADGARSVIADCQYREGKLDEALAAALTNLEGPSLFYRTMAAGLVARLYLERGRYREALSVVEKARSNGTLGAFPQCTIDLLSTRASVLFELGQHEDARKALQSAQSFRASSASRIEDAELRHAFLTRGQANRRLDQLANAWPSK